MSEYRLRGITKAPNNQCLAKRRLAALIGNPVFSQNETRQNPGTTKKWNPGSVFCLYVSSLLTTLTHHFFGRIPCL